MPFSHLNASNTMDPAACPVIYIDDRVKEERWITRGDIKSLTEQPDAQLRKFDEGIELIENISAILSGFKNVYLCNSGKTFSSKIAELCESMSRDCIPIFAFYDVGFKEKVGRTKSDLEIPSFGSRDSSPVAPPMRRALTFRTESEENYGLQLLSKISSDVQVQDAATLVISVAVLRSAARSPTTPTGSDSTPIDSAKVQKCLDAGAVDVLTSPILESRIPGLVVLALRYHRDATKEQQAFLSTRKLRKQSWVGLDDQKPYAYLRESMVSKLMLRICSPTEVNDFVSRTDLRIPEERKAQIAVNVGQWNFCAHDFSEDELVYAGSKMLEHALSMPDVERWQLTSEQLLRFMQASRAAYNSFVLYHNFRHAVDVLQSLFTFLLRIGALPPYGADAAKKPLVPKSPVAALLKPFETLTLLIAAIGHDVGHPGVNNAFLVNLNAPLAQLYNDVSVLEAFHCAAFSQILRQHWPVAFESRPLRKLLISNILATDMALHARYIEDLGNLQAHFHSAETTDSWSPQQVDKYKVLISGLLIKCADISNVARPWRVAEQWTDILQKEFANQGDMEKEVGMETALFGGPPEIGNILKLANGQIFFMGMLAHPLFAGMADLLPGMDFAQAQILANKAVWEERVELEKSRVNPLRHDSILIVSPRTKYPRHPGSLAEGASPVSGEQGIFRHSIAVPPPLSLEDRTPKQSQDSCRTQPTDPISAASTFNLEDLPQDVFGINGADDSGTFSGKYSGKFRGTWIEGEVNGLVNDRAVSGTFAQHILTGATEKTSSTLKDSSSNERNQRHSRYSQVNPLNFNDTQTTDSKIGMASSPQDINLSPDFLSTNPTPQRGSHDRLKQRPTSSPPVVANTSSPNGQAKFHNGHSYRSGNGDSPTGDEPQRVLPRRRSRMRLAFWRRKSPTDDSIET